MGLLLPMSLGGRELSQDQWISALEWPLGIVKAQGVQLPDFTNGRLGPRVNINSLVTQKAFLCPVVPKNFLHC